MITITIMGGLGNQLFQIVTTIAAALRNHDTFFFYGTSAIAGASGTFATHALEHPFRFITQVSYT